MSLLLLLRCECGRRCTVRFSLLGLFDLFSVAAEAEIEWCIAGLRAERCVVSSLRAVIRRPDCTFHFFSVIVCVTSPSGQPTGLSLCDF